MKFALLCKRYYTNKDLIEDQFGRLFHLPVQLGMLGHQGLVIAADYRSSLSANLAMFNVNFCSFPFSIRYLFNFISQCYKTLHQFKPDLLIASGDIHFGFLGLIIARRLNIPFIYDIYDNYTAFPHNRIPGMRSLFGYIINHSDLVISASIPLSKQLAVLNSSIIVIENGIDPNLFYPISKKDARARLILPEDEIIIGFFGSIYYNRGVDILIEAANMLRQEIRNLRLLIAGHNSLNLDLNVSGIDYRGLLPQQEIPILINACDVVIIPYLPDKQVAVSNACKAAEYIACGVPVVATRVSNQADIFAEAQQGLCTPGDPADMARAIKAQLENPQKVTFPIYLTWQNLAITLSEALIKMI